MNVQRWLVVLFVATAVPQLQADEALAWKLSEGDSLTYRVSNALEMTSSSAGLTEKMTLNQAMDMDWVVVEKLNDAAESVLVNQIIRRIVVRMSPNGVDEFTFDSDTRERPANRIVLSLGRAFQKIVNEEFVVTMESTGNVSDVAIPNSLLNGLRSAAAGSPGALDERSLRQMMSQASVVLPEGEVAKGHKWTHRQEVELQFATLEMNPRMTYEGLNDDGYAVIDYVPVVALKANPKADIRLTLSESSGDGEVLFDPERGRVVRMELNLNMKMKASKDGQVNMQTIRQRTEMKLAETSDR